MPVQIFVLFMYQKRFLVRKWNKNTRKTIIYIQYPRDCTLSLLWLHQSPLLSSWTQERLPNFGTFITIWSHGAHREGPLPNLSISGFPPLSPRKVLCGTRCQRMHHKKNLCPNYLTLRQVGLSIRLTSKSMY